MKKICLILLSALLLTLLPACDGTAIPPETEGVTAAPTAGVTEAATEAPATGAPATEAPATEAPATEAPVTEAPATEAPVTEAPVTEAPVTEAPVTEAPAPPETQPETEEETTVTYEYVSVHNPIHNGGGDPWVVEREGEYYYCYSHGNGVSVARVPSIHQLAQNGVRVYTAPGGTAYSHEYWAPELHYIDGAWYIYVAADDGDNYNHRMYVLRGTTQDPTDPFEMVGKITDPTDKWAIDGTVLQLNGELYFVWSGWKGNVNVAQRLYIAHMSNPWTVDGERVELSSPEYDWERVGQPYINEGPAVLQHEGRTFLVYSASGSWTDDYCLGMLTLTGDDPTDPAAWEKSSEPVFRRREGVCYGPGHCSFSTAPDGSVWMAFHGNLVSGTGWEGRSVWISPVTFDEDGNPDFGQPERVVKFPVRK